MKKYKIQDCHVAFIHYMLSQQLAPGHTKLHFTALARSCSNIQSALRSQANLDIFCGKGPITASSQRPWHCYKASMAFYAFIQRSCWRFSTLLRRFHCVFTAPRKACTALSRRMHCADHMLKTQHMDFPTFPKLWPGAC